MTPGRLLLATAAGAFVTTFAACEALRAVAPRGSGFRPAMTRRVVLFVGRLFVVALVVVAGVGLLRAPAAPLTAGTVAGWLCAAAREFAHERRTTRTMTNRPATSKEP